LLRIAIFGCGKMALQHAAAVRQQRNVQLVAVADTNLTPDEIRQRFGDSVEAFADPPALLEGAKPDVVHVVTPPHTHAELARLCLEHGVHAYVEKPFAPTAEEASRLLDLAAERKLKLCPAHQVLFQRPGQRYQDFLPIIGKVVHVESYFSFRPVRRRPDGGAPLSAVDQLIDILPHPVYLLLSALGDAAEHARVSGLAVDPDGEARAIVSCPDVMATLIVTLRGRPIESYLKVVGTNGSVEADFVLGSVVKLLGPGASAPAVVLKPFSQSWQTAWGSFVGLLRLIFGKEKSYPGLAELLRRFYHSISTDTPPPIDRQAILQTVRVCEQIGDELKRQEAAEEKIHAATLDERTRELPETDPDKGIVLVTGGTGFLGRVVLSELRAAGFGVRALCRSIPATKKRIPGVDYVTADLGAEVPASVMSDISVVAHLAAETAGNQAAHERNTIRATRNLLEAMVSGGVKRLINISSVAVHQPSKGAPITEESPDDRGNLARGPYVWAKAEAEAIAEQYADTVETRTLRLGPLVDYESFTAPGRLGREIARLFVAAGMPSSSLSVCDVHTAAAVIRDYASHFEEAPRLVNLLEVPAPTRRDLVERLRAVRPDLRFVWLPFPLLRMLSMLAIGLQKLLRPKKPALDLYAAFKSERYDLRLAGRVIDGARTRAR